MRDWVARLGYVICWEAAYQADPLRELLELNRFGWIAQALEAQIERSPIQNLRLLQCRETHPAWLRRFVKVQKTLEEMR